MILINGEPVEQISVFDRGLHYGDGLFETISVKNARLQHWALHWQRFNHGCQQLNLTAPDEALVLDEIATVLDNESQAVIKLMLTRGSGGRGYKFPPASKSNRIIFRYSWPEFNPDYDYGISLYLCETRLGLQPRLAGIKHLNRLENILARNEWQDDQFAEGLVLSANEHVIEGTMSNVFWSKAGRLFTPRLTQCGVNGVMRQHLIKLAATLEIDTSIDDFHLDAVIRSDEIFVCNSLVGVWPVKSFQHKHFDVTVDGNPVTRKLKKMMNVEWQN